MSVIHEFSVVDPPTNREVHSRFVEALGRADNLRLRVLGVQEIPVPEPQDVSLKIKAFLQLEEGVMRVSGIDGDNNSVVVTIGQDPTQLATASMVVAG